MIVFYCATIVPIVRLTDRALGPYIICIYYICPRAREGEPLPYKTV